MTIPELLVYIVGGLTLPGGGGYFGWRWAVKRAEEARAVHSKREKQLLDRMDQLQRELERRRASDPPTSLEKDRENRRIAARAAGFSPGDTGRYDAVNSLGEMRCNECENLHKAVDEIRMGASASASSAAMTNAAVIRIEENFHQFGEKIDKALEKFGEKVESVGREQARFDERLKATERELDRRGPLRGAPVPVAGG